MIVTPRTYPTIPLATHCQRFALPVSNHENQSEARKVTQMSPLYYLEKFAVCVRGDALTGT